MTAAKRGKEDGDAATAAPAATAGARGSKSMDDIIRSITQRRQQQKQQQQMQQQQDSVMSHEMWLTMDNADIYRRLKSVGSGVVGSAKASG